MSPLPAAVLFDLDGTLVDSLPDIAAAVNRVLAAEGRALLTPAEVRPMIGDGAGQLVERAFTARGGLPQTGLAAVLTRFRAEYGPRSAELTRPWPGVVEVLDGLRDRGVRMAVCTNKPSGATHTVLRELGLSPYFPVVVGSDDAPAIKPDPSHVRACLDALAVAPQQTVMVGDSRNDVLAAHAAGLPCVLVSFGYTRIPPAELGAEAVIDDFAALPSVLSRWG